MDCSIGSSPEFRFAAGVTPSPSHHTTTLKRGHERVQTQPLDDRHADLVVDIGHTGDDHMIKTPVSSKSRRLIGMRVGMPTHSASHTPTCTTTVIAKLVDSPHRVYTMYAPS